MQKVLRRKPSAPMVVAVTALVFAASGTAIAAGGLVNGDKLIAKRSLSGNRLRNNTLTGTQINVKKLGKVPSAKLADLAKLATLATRAKNATNATRAASSATTDSIKTWYATAFIGQTVTLLAVGPFTYTGQCTAGPHAQTFVQTSQPNSIADSYAHYVSSGYPDNHSNIAFGPATGAISVGYGSNEHIADGSPNWVGPFDGSDTQISADGHTYVSTYASVGSDILGVACLFVGHAIVVSH